MENRIRKVKLSNGQVYSFFDAGALRLNSDNILLTGDSVVDQVILEGDLYITEIDDVPYGTDIENVLVQDTTTKQVMKRDKDLLLGDIGGATFKMDDSTSTLSLKIGKFEEEVN